MYTCDRCGDIKFFSTEPAAWEFEVGVGDLCPMCRADWKDVKARFKRTTNKFW